MAICNTVLSCKTDFQSFWTLGILPTVWCELKSLSSVVDASFPRPTSFPVRPLFCVHERRAVHLWCSLWGLGLLYLPGHQRGRKCPRQGSAGSGNSWVSGITVHPTQQMASLEIIVKKTPSIKLPERERTQCTQLSFWCVFLKSWILILINGACWGIAESEVKFFKTLHFRLK